MPLNLVQLEQGADINGGPSLTDCQTALALHSLGFHPPQHLTLSARLHPTDTTVVGILTMNLAESPDIPWIQLRVLGLIAYLDPIKISYRGVQKDPVTEWIIVCFIAPAQYEHIENIKYEWAAYWDVSHIRHIFYNVRTRIGKLLPLGEIPKIPFQRER